MFTGTAVSAGTKVALVPSSQVKGDTQDILDLATVELTNAKHIEVLDRQQVGRLLKEQELSLTLGSSGETALKTGQLLGVDLFAVLWVLPEGKGTTGVIVFDAHTGVRLIDRGLASAPQAAAKDLVAAIDAANIKRQRKNGHVKTVTLLSVRNSELPKSKTGSCQSLGVLLQRDLLNTPELAVLEREHLRWVNEEGKLLGAAALKQLRLSLVLIELDFRQGDAPDTTRVHAVLSDVTGSKIESFTVDGSLDDTPGLYADLLKATRRALDASPPTQPLDAKQEADRLLAEAERRRHFRDSAGRWELLEAGLALDPGHQMIRYRLMNRFDYVWGMEHAKTDADVRDKVNRTLRMGEQRIAMLRYRPDYNRGWSRGSTWFKQVADIMKWYAGPKATAEHRAIINPLRQQIRQYVDMRVRAWGEVFEPGRGIHMLHAEWAAGMLYDVAPAYDRADAYWGLVERVGTQWLTRMAHSEPAYNTIGDGDYLQMLMYRLVPSDTDRGVKLPGGDHASALVRLADFHQRMTWHPHPVVKLWGKLGIVQRQAATGELAVDERDRQLRALRADAMQLMQEPGAWPVDQLRLDCVDFIETVQDRFDSTFDAETLVKVEAMRKTLVPPDPFDEKWSSLRGHRLIQVKRQQVGRPPMQPLFNVGDAPDVNAARAWLREGDKLVGLGIGDGKAVLLEVPLNGGKARSSATVDVPVDLPRSSRDFHFRNGVAASMDTRVYAAAFDGEGLVVMPRDGSPGHYVGVDQGLPNPWIRSVAVLDGQVYAGLHGGYLVRYDPAAKRIDVIASGNRIEPQCVLDRMGAFAVPVMVVDAARKRLVLVAYGSEWDHSGVYAYDPANGELQKLYGLRAVLTKFNWAGPVRDNRVLMASSNCIVDFDLVKHQFDVIQSTVSFFNRPDFHMREARCHVWLSAMNPPYLVHDDWIYSASPFERVSLGDDPVRHQFAKKTIYHNRREHPVFREGLWLSRDGREFIAADETRVYRIDAAQLPGKSGEHDAINRGDKR